MSPAYRESYSRINGMVIVGEGLADLHFRRLALLLPAERNELLRLAAMEARHARDFLLCGRNLGIRADSRLARRLLSPLHQQFQEAEKRGDPLSCLVIQCLVIESIAVAAYGCYLPVADSDARAVTASVLQDEAEHLDFGERWLGDRFPACAAAVEACCRQVVPVALGMLQELQADLETLGIDAAELIAAFQLRFQQSLEAIGFERRQGRRLLLSLTAQAFSNPS
jgi:fatty aldehyde decarbonylase